ncbi:hypothetical protein [Saccharopolyspora sp. 6V]|uniref:hypothetical protein n=1 Tax=Saccharopolyspora sp. 6V TaxID=2877239 RepID=UPI001CD7391E|nr:hypothetical protein [Saccharopolyspora sp. 6V]MCA1191620.1 hypothetical protein [Saccharopolyspora sp. 6V]
MQARSAAQLEAVRANAALEDASGFVRGESGRDWTAEAVPAPIVAVVLRCALRLYSNPDFLASDTETAGPFSRSRTLNKDAQSGYLTDEEILLCRRYGQRRTGLWTLGTTRGEDYEYDPEQWVMDQYGSEPFPVGDP